jgi:hypothetical protein
MKANQIAVRQILDESWNPIAGAEVFVRRAEYKDARPTTVKSGEQGFVRLSFAPQVLGFGQSKVTGGCGHERRHPQFRQHLLGLR